MMITILLLIILILLMYNYYYIHHGKNGKLINRIPGPPGYPIIGNVLMFLGPREELWKIFITISNQYYSIFKIWNIICPIVFIRHPDDLKTILSNSKHIEKSMIYSFLEPWGNTGIFTSGGAKWHSRRKILNPTFHFNILREFVEIFIKESENMTKSLKNTGGTVVKDLLPFATEHTLNAICETAMGTSLQNLDASQQPYREMAHRMGEFVIYRFTRPWLWIDWIFSLTPKGREQKKVLKILHRFTKQIIAKRKLYHEYTNGRYLQSFDNDTSIEGDDSEPVGIRRKRLAMLDILIAASHQGLMSDLDIQEEVDTFMYAGYDTVASALCFTLALLAEHKDIQDRARNEVKIALEENGNKFNMKLFQGLEYLERCIKESLRLYPSGPVISRSPQEDVKLQSYLVSAGTFIFLNIYSVHRDPNFWPNPEIFDPDRFLPEKIRNYHPYSYIPFSAGPRNCIGHRFAMLEMKVLVAHLINNFYLEPIDYLKNLRIQLDFILRPVHPLRVRFVPVCNTDTNL